MSMIIHDVLLFHMFDFVFSGGAPHSGKAFWRGSRCRWSTRYSFIPEDSGCASDAGQGSHIRRCCGVYQRLRGDCAHVLPLGGWVLFLASFVHAACSITSLSRTMRRWNFPSTAPCQFPPTLSRTTCGSIRRPGFPDALVRPIMC